MDHPAHPQDLHQLQLLDWFHSPLAPKLTEVLFPLPPNVAQRD